jgi:hypothetical protein
VKRVVEILGGIYLHVTPCCTVYSISVPLHPHPVSELVSKSPFPPGEAISNDDSQGSAGENLPDCQNLY